MEEISEKNSEILITGVFHQIDKAKPVSDLTNVDFIVDYRKKQNGYLTRYDQNDLKKLKKMLGNPEMEVTIYRASPKNELNTGDWITTDRIYAMDIKRQNGGKIYKYTTKVKNLYFPDDLDILPSSSIFSAFKYMGEDL